VLVFALASAATVATAYGAFLTKDLGRVLPMWQTIAPLYALNALCATPLLITGAWRAGRPDVWLLHGASVATMTVTTWAVFALLQRGSASAVATAQALSPAAVLLIAPLALGQAPSAAAVAATTLLVVGAVLPLRRVFSGLRGHEAVTLMLVAGTGTGLLTVLTAMLTTRHVGTGPIYVVRTAVAAAAFWVLVPPRDIGCRALPRLAVRSGTVSVGFVLTIAAVQHGGVLLVQCMLATTPLLVTALETVASRRRPSVATVLAGVVCSTGIALLATSSR
jgi:uncharacterized membrane protein